MATHDYGLDLPMDMKDRLGNIFGKVRGMTEEVTTLLGLAT